MRSLVTAVYLIMQAIASAIAQAFVAISADPLLVINYGVFAGLSFVSGCLFWAFFRKLDAQENELNDMRRGENYNEATSRTDGFLTDGDLSEKKRGA